MANLLRYLQYGYAPDVVKMHLNFDRLKPYTKACITQKIDKILADNPGKKFKIGKTGCADIRVDQIDYREAAFTKMFLLYQHTNQQAISELESYYIQKYKERYPRKCVNKHLHSGGGMNSPTAYFYLYLVI